LSRAVQTYQGKNWKKIGTFYRLMLHAQDKIVCLLNSLSLQLCHVFLFLHLRFCQSFVPCWIFICVNRNDHIYSCMILSLALLKRKQTIRKHTYAYERVRQSMMLIFLNFHVLLIRYGYRLYSALSLMSIVN
jgi:hypothetical protein